METTSNLGMNRTGAQMSPKDVKTMASYSRQQKPTSQGDLSGIAALRRSYITEAREGLGSVPVPGTAKGMAKSGIQMLKGARPQTLVDKLAERLAFERSGVRLYESLIVKYDAANGGGGIAEVPRDMLVHIRDEEAQHFALLVEAMQSLGADSTAQTPCADLVGVESQGLIQAITDPRTTLAQSLHAILVAELVDNDGWELLIELAQAEGQKDLAARFEQARQTEQDHLDNVRRWVSALTLGESRLVAKPS